MTYHLAYCRSCGSIFEALTSDIKRMAGAVPDMANKCPFCGGGSRTFNNVAGEITFHSPVALTGSRKRSFESELAKSTFDRRRPN